MKTLEHRTIRHCSGEYFKELNVYGKWQHVVEGLNKEAQLLRPGCGFGHIRALPCISNKWLDIMNLRH